MQYVNKHSILSSHGIGHTDMASNIRICSIPSLFRSSFPLSFSLIVSTPPLPFSFLRRPFYILISE